MRLVDDHQVRGGAQEVVPTPLRLDEVGGHHGDRVALEQRLPEPEGPLQSRDGARQHQFRLQPELAPQLLAPLLGQRGRAQHGHARARCPAPAARWPPAPPPPSCRSRRRRRSAAGPGPAATPSAAARTGRDGGRPQVRRGCGTGRPRSGTPPAARPAAAGRCAGPRGRPARAAANVAGSTSSRWGSTPATSSSPPASGRSTRKSGLLSGSTTHSRPRARTREPTAWVGAGLMTSFCLRVGLLGQSRCRCRRSLCSAAGGCGSRGCPEDGRVVPHDLLQHRIHADPYDVEAVEAQVEGVLAGRDPDCRTPRRPGTNPCRRRSTRMPSIAMSTGIGKSQALASEQFEQSVGASAARTPWRGAGSGCLRRSWRCGGGGLGVGGHGGAGGQRLQPGHRDPSVDLLVQHLVAVGEQAAVAAPDAGVRCLGPGVRVDVQQG